MRQTNSNLPPFPLRPAAPSELRRRQALELAARALGATRPGMVAMSLDLHTQDLTEAIGALRQSRPEWFMADATDNGAAGAAAPEAMGDVPATPRCSMA